MARSYDITGQALAIGEQASNLLGSLLLSHLQLLAMARSELAPKNRVPFFVHVDEFQSFSTDAFASLLSEARKFATHFSLANQYTEQLSDNVVPPCSEMSEPLWSFECRPRMRSFSRRNSIRCPRTNWLINRRTEPGYDAATAPVRLPPTPRHGDRPEPPEFRTTTRGHRA
jgi:hypothetical protein